MTDYVVEIGTIGWREYLSEVKKLTLRRYQLRFFQIRASIFPKEKLNLLILLSFLFYSIPA